MDDEKVETTETAVVSTFSKRGVFMKRIRLIWDDLEKYLMMLFLVVLFLNVFVQICMRVFFNSPLTFTEEVSRYAFCWMVFLGLSYSTKHGKHIRLDLIPSRLPDWLQLVLTVFIHLLTIVIFLWIFITGIKYVDYTKINITYALQIKKSYIVLILPLSGFLMVVRSIERCVFDINAFRRRRLDT